MYPNIDNQPNMCLILMNLLVNVAYWAKTFYVELFKKKIFPLLRQLIRKVKEMMRRKAKPE